MTGNVVVGFCTDCYLMLDCDVIPLRRVVRWCRKYTKEMGLGSVIVGLTSINKQLTIDRKRLPNNYLAVFGKRISQQENRIHIENAYQDGIVNKGFRDMRFYGLITERVNRKNYAISPPKIRRYIPNGDNEGCMKYLEWWKWNKNVGMPYETALDSLNHS